MKLSLMRHLYKYNVISADGIGIQLKRPRRIFTSAINAEQTTRNFTGESLKVIHHKIPLSNAVAIDLRDPFLPLLCASSHTSDL